MSALSPNCGCVIPSPGTWDQLTIDFDHAIQGFSGRWPAAALNVLDELVKRVNASTGAFDVVVTADGVALTSPLFVGLNVALLSTDGQSYNSMYFRKGNIGDTDAQIKASDTITLTSPGAAFYVGQIVTIIPKAS